MIRFLPAFLLVIALVPLQGQQMLDPFGKNRIQFQRFEWSYLSSDNFDVFYYGERKRVAGEVVEYLEGEFDRITDLIGYPPYLKTKVFLYNSVADLQQSNVGLNRNPYIMGGETDFVKPYVEIAHPGTLDGFREELLLKVTDLMVNEMMFGGSLKDMFQNAVLLNLPEWFIRGVSMYAAKGWNEEMDDFARQLVRSRKVNRALSLSGREAALVGQSVWNFIVEKYGRSSVSNILNYSRVIRNEQRSVLITLGIPFRQLMVEWKNFYSTHEKLVSEHYTAPADSNRFTPSHRSSLVYTTMKLSPDGKRLAFAENDRGKYQIKVINLGSGRESTILTAGTRVLRQAVDYREPLLSWADEKTLGVIGKEHGTFMFWLYDLETKNKTPRMLEKFNNIRSFDFSGNGRLAVLSADQDGQNDLFLIAARRERVRRLTNDIYDDLDPGFIPGTNSIVFSSNRVTDTVNTRTRNFSKVATNMYNLFLFNLDSTSNVVDRLTNTLSRDYHPIALNENTFYYLSDQRGITNIFRYDRQTAIYTQMSNFASGIKTFDIHPASRQLALVSTKKLSEDIFLLKNFNFSRQVFTPPTRRKDIQQAKVITERRKKQAEKPAVTLKELMEQRLREFQPDTLATDTVPKSVPPKVLPPADTTVQKSDPGLVDPSNYIFGEPEVSKDTVVTLVPAPVEAPKLPVNTGDYVFEDEVVKKPQPVESVLNRFLKAAPASRVTGPFPYLPKFSYENVVTNFVIDPIRGFSVKMETQMNDMLENYRFYGGIQTAFDVKSGDVFAEFQYLPRRIDFSARVDRKVIYWDRPESSIQEKYSWQRIELGVSLPITARLRASVKPFAGFTRFADRGE